MPLYEGIALIQEKQAVVLDIGSEYTKCGLSGEAAPRCIVRSEVWCPRRRALRTLDGDDLYCSLVLLLHQLYFRHVLVNPKERRAVVVLSSLLPLRFSETLARVLYSHYEVASVLWLDSALAAAATLGGPVCLSVHVGAAGSQVCAVLHGHALLHTARASPRGLAAVRARLAGLLSPRPEPALLDELLAKACFVGGRARALLRDSGSPPAAARALRLRGGLRVSGGARELAAEVLFPRDGERDSLPELVLRCLQASPRDCRRALAGALLLWGGGAALAGLRARLGEELRARLAEEPLASRLRVEPRFVSAPAPGGCAGWLGGSLLAGAPGVSREGWRRRGGVPDWSDTRDNLPPGHYFREPSA